MAQLDPEYYTARKDTQLEDRSTIKNEKFENEALIWQAFCTCGQRL